MKQQIHYQMQTQMKIIFFFDHNSISASIESNISGTLKNKLISCYIDLHDELAKEVKNNNLSNGDNDVPVFSRSKTQIILDLLEKANEKGDNITYIDDFIKNDTVLNLEHEMPKEYITLSQHIKKVKSGKNYNRKRLFSPLKRKEVLIKRTLSKVMESPRKNTDRAHSRNSTVITLNNNDKSTNILNLHSAFDPHQLSKEDITQQQWKDSAMNSNNNINDDHKMIFKESIIKYVQLQKKLQNNNKLNKKKDMLQSSLSVNYSHNEHTLKKNNKTKCTYFSINNKDITLLQTKQIKEEELNKTGKDIYSKIFFYVKENNILYVQQLISEHFHFLNFNKLDKNGYTLLTLAALYSSEDILEYLLQLGLNPNIKDNHGNYPLHNALRTNSYGKANLLIKYGAKEDVRDSKGKTPWQTLKKREHKHL